jgi:hypothetical protein
MVPVLLQKELAILGRLFSIIGNYPQSQIPIPTGLNFLQRDPF